MKNFFVPKISSSHKFLPDRQKSNAITSVLVYLLFVTTDAGYRPNTSQKPTLTTPPQHHYNYYKMITCYMFHFQRDVIISMKIYMPLSPFIYLHFYIGHFLGMADLYGKNHYIITRRCVPDS